MKQETVQEQELKLVITRDKHLIYIFNTRLGKKIRYDLKRQTMQTINKHTGEWRDVKQQYEFFKNCSLDHLEFSDPKDEKFKKLIFKTQELNPACRSVSSFFSRMNQALAYEHYEEMGVQVICRVSKNSWSNRVTYKEIITKPVHFYNKPSIEFFKKHNILVGQTLESAYINHKDFIEGLVCMLPTLGFEDDVEKRTFETLIYDMAGYSSHFVSLVRNFGYEAKALIKYCINYLQPFENIGLKQALELLYDYYDMANRIGRHVKKYPKYLRSMHDIISANFDSFQRDYDEVLFSRLMKKELEFKGKKFCVVVPKTSKDIVSEGTSLNHCVSSYVDKVLKRKLYIFFLRKAETPDMSLVTMTLEGNAITAAKGSYNRAIEEEEKEFLKSYAKKLNLQLKLGG